MRTSRLSAGEVLRPRLTFGARMSAFSHAFRAPVQRLVTGKEYAAKMFAFVGSVLTWYPIMNINKRAEVRRNRCLPRRYGTSSLLALLTP
jgi:hypothetical protein